MSVVSDNTLLIYIIDITSVVLFVLLPTVV